MKYYVCERLRDFNAWCGGKDTLDVLIEKGDVDSVESLIEEYSCDEDWSDVSVNDFLWFDTDTIAQHLGYSSWDDYECGKEEWAKDADATLSELFNGGVNQDAIDTFIDEQWDKDEDDETNIIEFRKWFKENNLDESGKYRLKLDEDTTEKLTSSFEEDIDYDIAARFVEDSWDYDMSDDDNIQAFADWYEDMNGEKLTIL